MKRATWKKNSQLPAVENCNKMTKIKVAALQMPTVHDKMENVKEVGSYTAVVRLHKEVSAEIPFEVVAETEGEA